MNRYMIIKEEDGAMLTAICIQPFFDGRREDIIWTTHLPEALRFEAAEEAEAVITFIGDVMDWELAQQLYVKLLEF